MILRDRPTVRTALSLAALSAWVVVLFSGWTGAGAVHLLPVAAVVLFPWRATQDSRRGDAPEDHNT